MTRPKLALRIAVRIVDAIAAGVLAGLERLFPDPVDDTMALAASLGSDTCIDSSESPSAIPFVEEVIDWHAHPSHRPELEDANLGQLIELWGRESR